MEKIVLIIDDNESDVYWMKYAISKKDPAIRVEIASDGKAGLERLRDGAEMPSLIMLDLKMPGMDGFEVLREIRGDASIKHIPVIVVSHSDLERDVAESYEAGANDFLSKFADLDRFIKEVASMLERYL